MNGGFKHEVFRDSVSSGTQSGIRTEWILYQARITATQYRQISVVSQPMNSPTAAYESLLSILGDLHPVTLHLTADDLRFYADGCCSRCKLYQHGKHPEEYTRYQAKPFKRYQPGNR